MNFVDKEVFAKAAVESGVEPISLKYTPVCGFDDGKPFALRTELILNSNVLGNLTPLQYEVVADRTVRRERLTLWAVTYALKAMKFYRERPENIRFVTIKAPTRAAKLGFVKSLERILEKFPDENPERICLEFPVTILFEDNQKIAQVLKAIKSLGVQTMLTGFGDDFCPLVRINGLPFDYVVTHRNVSELLGKSKLAQIGMSVIDFARNNGYDVILENADSERAIEEGSQSGCKGYTPSEEYKDLDAI